MLFATCQSLGYKTFKASDDSVNVWWVAVLAAGEGWHNNHHAFPGSAKTGMLWHEFDISWLTILALKNLGLAHKGPRTAATSGSVTLSNRNPTAVMHLCFFFTGAGGMACGIRYNAVSEKSIESTFRLISC